MNNSSSGEAQTHPLLAQSMTKQSFLSKRKQHEHPYVQQEAMVQGCESFTDSVTFSLLKKKPDYQHLSNCYTPLPSGQQQIQIFYTFPLKLQQA
jgi:hypothetical protein